MAVILGKLPFRILLTAGSLLLIAVVLTCYGLAVSEGHVPAWLPSISSCGDKPPEKFIFTYGMLAVAALLFLESVCIYGADKPFSGSLPILLTSSVATFFLGIVGSVCSACDHGTGVHGSASWAFFILENIYMLLILYYSWGQTRLSSTALKTFCAVMGTLCIASKLLIENGKLQVIEESAIPGRAIVEWTDTVVLAVFHWSFCLDFEGYYLADVNTKSSQLATTAAVKQPLDLDSNETVGEKKYLV